MRVYYFTNEEYAVENIKERQLKLSFFDLVNDVFELKPFEFSDRKTRRGWQKCVNNSAKTQGFVSFSELWSVPTMWAHYANNHQGVCYGFDLCDDQAVKINYVEKLEEFDQRALNNTDVNKETVKYASRTKSSHWRYEKEWRQCVSLDSKDIARRKKGEELFFINFNKRLVLKKVIIGARSSITSKSIASVLRQSDEVEIITARPSFREFKMVKQQRIELQK